MKEKNPFNPSFGEVPKVFIDRDDEVKRIVSEYNKDTSPYHTSLISGQRGTGKTAFMTDICNAIKKDPKWIVINLPATGNLVDTLIESLAIQADSSLNKILKKIEKVSFSAVVVSADISLTNKTPSGLNILREILQVIKKEQKKLLISIDEVTNSENIRQLVSNYQVLRRESLPVYLIMTGLPKNISDIQNDEILTFLLRAEKIQMEMLDILIIKENYYNIFTKANIKIDTPTTITLAKMTNGFAYGFQLLGYLLWEEMDDEINDKTIKAIESKYKTYLFRNVYKIIYNELSTIDKEFVFVMANSENNNVERAYIDKTLNKPKSYTSKYRQRLIDAQVIYVPQRGYLSFLLPYFKEFLLETFEMEN